MYIKSCLKYIYDYQYMFYSYTYFIGLYKYDTGSCYIVWTGFELMIDLVWAQLNFWRWWPSVSEESPQQYGGQVGTNKTSISILMGPIISEEIS